MLEIRFSGNSVRRCSHRIIIDTKEFSQGMTAKPVTYPQSVRVSSTL